MGRLEHLLYRLLSLMDSQLYRRVLRRAQAPRVLRMTNLLSNDDDYRGVARLWHHWYRLAAPRALSPHELYARHQDLHCSFDAWCMLVIVRACSQLGLGPPEDADFKSEIRPGCAIQLDTGLRVEWEQAGTITLADEDRVLLRCVPLVHAIERAKTRKAVTARVAPLVQAAAGAAHWTVVLHPAIPGKPPHDALAGVGNPPAPGTHDAINFEGAIDFIRVSPFSLDSVERVSRAIRWATLAPRMLAYPPTLRTGRESSIGSLLWRLDRGKSNWAVVRPSRPDELSEFAGRLAKARADRDRLMQERQKVQDDLQRAQGDGRSRTRLNRRKSQLLKQVRDAEGVVERLEDFEREFEKAHHKVVTLATCPACGEEDADFEERENDCFAAHCKSNSCASEWGLRHDPGTRSRIPVFLQHGADLGARRTDGAPQWVDDVLGCDVLAIPEDRDGGDVEFLPPRTDRYGVSLRILFRQ